MCSALIALVGFGGLIANSQDIQEQSLSSPDLSAKKGDRSHYMDRLTKKLKLTPEQQAKLKPIIGDEQTQIEAVQQDDTLSKEQRHARIANIRATARPQIEAVLTPDRQKKFAALKDEEDDR